MLATPSEPVQRAVSDCMPALMPGLSSDRPYVEALVARLLRQLGHESYGHRCVSAGALHGHSQKVRDMARIFAQALASGFLCNT